MATMEGSLSKWTNVMKGWQYRWFVLDDNAGLLSYYTSREKMMRGNRRGCVRLKGAVIGIDDEDDSTFTITVDSKTFHFQARDADEREKWIRGLEDTILRHAFDYKCVGSLRLNSVKPAPTIHDFDKKLAEADAYLQILIDQTKALELRMEPMTDVEDKARCEAIWNHATNMLEQVKHTIVLLQIAKNTVHPVNGTYQPISMPDSINTVMTGSDRLSLSVSNSNDVETGIELGAECIEPRLLHVVYSPALDARVPHVRLPLSLNVPDTSYSSSEEEDFYDANDTSEMASAAASPSRPVEPLAGNGTSVGAVETQNASESTPISLSTRPSAIYKNQFIRPDGTLDYDALYDDTEETDFSMESQGSVVTHLLSQVKIGMDLTKVVLPTFILERRSLLEMYADYFAHPDMFVKIAELSSERERMVQVVRWYLCSYHAGRKSGVAKKPYNPVLGEVFRCYWDLPGNDADSDAPVVEGGPVPWCHADQLTFVAEQVSHHPPISAFYAEHYDKRISFTAHVWTKSKFLGLSIGVHNIGQGIIDILDYNEQYVVTFPNGYGRSILTVPWIELGGAVKIACEKTGYRADIEFVTKPFYGGKKHRITAEVMAPHEKKPFLSIIGEWNGIMEAKWTEGRLEQFANVNNLSIIRKQVQPVDQQSDNESRRLWKEVTAGLRLNNVTRATNAKSEIEQRQRVEAQGRRESGTPWQTRLFTPEANDQWVYTQPLATRLANSDSRALSEMSL